MRNKIIILVIIVGAILTCCNIKHVQVKQETETNNSMFIVIEQTPLWKIVYNKETKVMYAVSNGYYNAGTFTMLCDKDGKPQLWKEIANESII